MTTIKELKDRARDLKIKGFSTMKKDELITAIASVEPKNTVVSDMPSSAAKKIHPSGMNLYERMEYQSTHGNYRKDIIKEWAADVGTEVTEYEDIDWVGIHTDSITRKNSIHLDYIM